MPDLWDEETRMVNNLLKWAGWTIIAAAVVIVGLFVAILAVKESG